jgi:hypothetical protein
MKAPAMTTPFNPDEAREHFAHCVQIFGGVTSASRRLGIDERAIRRFINGDLAVSPRLMGDTAQALQAILTEAGAAHARIASDFTDAA